MVNNKDLKEIIALMSNMTPKEAVHLQKNLTEKINLSQKTQKINSISGSDISFNKKTSEGYAGTIVYSYPEFTEIERSFEIGQLTFPYIPGLLSFREAPLLLKTIGKLKKMPDLFIFDGQGIAHPRRMGIATHMGIILKKPTIGCAKSHLTGNYKEVDFSQGSYSYLYDNDDVIGAVLRTRENVKPIFISPGHLISLDSSLNIILNCCDGLRIPRPTREADKYVAHLKRIKSP